VALLRFTPSFSPAPVVLASCSLAVSVAPLCAATAEAKRAFDLPRGDAATTLRQFAAASGRSLVFVTDKVRGESTNAVRGQFTPRDALERMLAGSALEAAQDAATGALVVSRRRTAEPAPRPGEVGPVSDPQPKPKTTPMNSPLTRRAAALFAGWLASIAAANAQTVANASGANETVTLSPFVVNTDQDRGYIAADTISGGRLSVNLLQSPNDVSALTREFLDDIGAVSLNDAAIWLTSAAVAEPADNRDFGGNVTLRGLSTGNNTRDFFLYQTSTEEYIVQRIEGARGPNSIIYGDASSGGVVNVVTKRAGFKDSGRFLARFDSEGSRRATVDINRRVSGKFALRLNALAQDRRTWVERFYDRRFAADLAGTYRPWRGGELRFETELTFTRTAEWGYVFSDTSSLWDRQTTVDRPLTANLAASTGIVRFTNDQLVVSPSLPGVTNFRNFGRTNGTFLSVGGENRPFAEFPVLPRRSFRIAPEQSNLSVHTRNVAVFFEQKIGDLNVEAAAASSSVDREGIVAASTNTFIDVNRVLPSGQANPNFGKRYSENTYAFNKTPNVIDNYRIAGAYPLVFGPVRQILSAVAQRRQDWFSPRSSGFARTKDPTNTAISPALNNANNQVYFWRYWDRADAPFSLPENRDGYEFTQYLTRDTRRASNLDSIQFNTIGYYFGNRLTLVGGIRADRYDVQSRTGLFDANARRAGERLTAVEAKADTKSVGIVYFPWPAIGAYANYSEGFTPQSDENPWIGSRGPVFTTHATNKSGGLRLRLFKGNLVGSMGYYESTEFDRQSNVISARTQINQIWTDLDKGELTIAGPFSIINDSIDLKGKGWELDLTANIANRFRMRLNFALPKTAQTNAFPDLKAYYAANIAEWQAGASDPTNPNRVRIQTNISNFANTLSSAAEGRSLNGTYKWRANFFGNYELRSGPLKGLRLGGGANLFGRRLIGNAVGRSYEYIYAKEYFLLTATAGYDLKIRRQPVTLSLYAYNLLDYSDPIHSGVSVFGGVAYRGGFSYANPRSVSLTVSVPF
jgi:iron complex outermembrane receptor protein